MKIAILTDKFHPGSTPKVIGEEVRFLRSFGNSAEAVSIFEGYPGGDQYRDFLSDLPIRFLSKEFSNLFNLTNFKFPLFSFFSTGHLTSPYLSSKIIKHKEYDAIVSHATYTCITARKIKKKKHIPYFAFIWDPISYILPYCYNNTNLRYSFPALLPLGRKLDKFLMSESLSVLLCSHFHEKMIKSLTDNPIDIIYPGCDPLEKIPIERGKYILALDRWDKGNSPNKLLKILQYLPSHAELVIAGFWYPPSLRESFTREMRALGLEKQVTILGPANREQLTKLYSNARVLIHPIEEVFGFVPHEAAACGCPVIMPATSGNTEILKHNTHGYFPSSYDPEQYAKYIDKLLCNERRAWKMGHNAWNQVKKHSWKEHTIALEKIINKYI